MATSITTETQLTTESSTSLPPTLAQPSSGLISTTATAHDPLTNTIRPLSDAVVTVRFIKSFEYRTHKNVVLQHVDLEKTTVGGFKERLMKEIATQGALRPYRGAPLDTLKIYTKAHGAKTTNLIINFEHEEWILDDDGLTLAQAGFENEIEVSFFNRQAYEQFKANPEIKWV